MGLLDNLLAPFGTGAQQNAANAQISGLQAGQAGALNNLGQGRTDIQNAYAAGLQPLNQNYATATQGTNALAQLLGIAPGSNAQSVQASLANTPGYQFTLNQGTQNVDRNAAATGSLNSGNTDTALANYTTGLANQTYQNAVQNLNPYLGMAQNTGGQIANTEAGLAGALSGNEAQQAGVNYGTGVGIGNAQANAALAPLQAGQNLWGLGTNLAKLGVSGGGQSGGTLGGNALTGLGNMASGLFGGIFNKPAAAGDASYGS